MDKTQKEEIAQIVAEAMRQATNPKTNERLALQERPDVKKVRRVECLSPNTGGKFTAVIADSKTFNDYGRVVGIEDYKYPYSPEAEFCGLPVHKDAKFTWGNGPTNVLLMGQGGVRLPQLTRNAKQTLATMTYQADLREFVGKPFPPHIQIDAPVQATIETKTPAQSDAKKL